MVHYLLLILGVFACATSVIMLKAGASHPVVVSAGRLLLASLLLAPLLFAALRVDRRPLSTLLLRSAPGAALLAAHFITWVIGARNTSAANGSLIVNLVPVAMPVFMFLLFRETLTRREVIGSLVALAGVAVLSAPNLRFDASAALGDAMCFLSMLLVTGYLVVSRLRNDGGSIWLYVVPLYFLAGLMCAALALFWPGPAAIFPAGADPRRELLLLLGLAVIPTIVGHSLLNKSMRVLPGQTVSIFNLGQFIFAGVMAYLFYREVPSPRLYIAGAMVVAGAALVVTARRAVASRHGGASASRQAEVAEE
jgi:drug/metabolite transporter (DMT)-like permease